MVIPDDQKTTCRNEGSSSSSHPKWPSKLAIEVKRSKPISTSCSMFNAEARTICGNQKCQGMNEGENAASLIGSGFIEQLKEKSSR